MIRQESFTKEWIDRVSTELNYKDKNLIEKVIRALALLEMLVKAGCPLIFKGGTALMLLLGKTVHRLSVDIDVICPPGTDIEKYLRDFGDAYLATSIERGNTTIERYSGSPLYIKDMQLLPSVSNKLNKLKISLPEAFYYWVKTSELLELQNC